MTENSASDRSRTTPDPTDETPTPAASSADEFFTRTGDASMAERYGVKRGMTKGRKITLGVFGLALLCGVAGYIGWNEAHPKIQAIVINYTVENSTITVTFQVNKAASQAVDCTLQAEDTQGNVIGSVNVSVPSGRSQAVEVSAVNTTGTPNTAVVSSCNAVS